MNTENSVVNRRRFLGFSAGAAGLFLLPQTALSQVAASQSSVPASSTPGASPQKIAKPDPLKSELVKEFVVAGHVDLDKTRAMLAETPGLLNCSWDWGGGDFEMAIGGAGHMGRRDIAMFLISQGSRYDIFVAAMLGRLDLVKAALTANPELANSRGPHGIPLMAHAKKGGDEAAETVKFLEAFKG